MVKGGERLAIQLTTIKIMIVSFSPNSLFVFCCCGRLKKQKQMDRDENIGNRASKIGWFSLFGTHLKFSFQVIISLFLCNCGDRTVLTV